MSTGTLTYFGKVFKDLLRNDLDTYRSVLPDILRSLEWQQEDGIWKMPSKTEPEYAINLKIQTGDVSIINEAGTGTEPDSVSKEFDGYFKELVVGMYRLVIVEELVPAEEAV